MGAGWNRLRLVLRQECRLCEKQSSYRPGGWWFLPKWLPDTEEHDVGPFKTKTAALAEAERLAAHQPTK